jgi:hypothetical protein
MRVMYLASCSRAAAHRADEAVRCGTQTDEVEQRGEADALPLADAAPALDTVVPRDLRAQRYVFELGQ